MEYTQAKDILELPEAQRLRVLQQYLDELADKKQEHKYGLYWNDTRHPENVVRQCDAEMPILEEVTPQYVHAKPVQEDLFDTLEKPEPTHILIEGDNYHALAVLAYTHARKVDLIYIDPPYNTGNRDFRYNDRFVEKEDGDRHTKWLSFMHRRLLLAKELLRESGVIFISIDDNEVAQLKLLCDKVFKDENFAANVIWQKKTSPDARKNLAAAHDYVLCYAKSIFNQKFNLIALSQTRTESYKNPDNDARGVWASVDLTGQTGHATSSQYYTIVSPKGNKFSPPEGRCWAIAESTINTLIKEGRIWFGKNGDSRPRLKKFLSETKGTTIGSLWTHQEVGSTQEATKELNQIMGFADALATTPKPIRLIERILKLTTAQDTPSVILDFFAGSGTTAHAVLELNRADGGNRQCILVTNNEVTDKTRKELTDKGLSPSEIEDMGICRAVTYPRVRKVIEGYTTPKGANVKGTGGKLRYFRCGFVKKQGAHIQNAENIKRHCTEMLCLRENIFHRIFPEILLPEDLDERENYTGAFEIFKDHNRSLAILYDDTPQYKTELQERLAVLSGEKILYVFTPTGNVSQLDYEDFDGVRLEEIPIRILDLYKRILK